MKAEFRFKDLLKALPGARWDSSRKAWTYPASPYAATMVLETLKDIAGPVDEEVEALALVQAKIEEIKNQTNLSPIPHTKITPWLHQVRGYHLVCHLPACCLAMEMGVGKSKVVVDYICNYLPEHTLIICPKSVIPVWGKEFAKHGWQAEQLKIVPLLENDLKHRARYAALQLECTTHGRQSIIFIANYEAIWQNDLGRWADRVEWDLVVCDEAHRIKSPSGKASRFIGHLKSQKRIGLTGTPMPHSPLDVYAQYRFLDPSIFGTSFVTFRTKYCRMGGYQNHVVIGFQNMEELNKKFYSIALRVTKDEVLDLPDVIDEERQVTLEPATMKAYKELENDFITQVKEGVIVASNALSKLVRLQQLTSGHCRTEDDVVVHLSDEKADELADLLDDLPAAEPVVVFARFKHDLAAIQRVAAENKRACFELSGRINQLADWQGNHAGSVLAVQIQAGGVGIDLTRARYCIYFSLSWSLGEFLQSQARLHRPGQNHKVTFIYLLAAGTVDMKIFKALEKREEVITAVLEMFHPADKPELATQAT